MSSSEELCLMAWKFKLCGCKVEEYSNHSTYVFCCKLHGGCMPVALTVKDLSALQAKLNRIQQQIDYALIVRTE